ncbi:hypothetical protein D3C76_1430640 [compost metagenome]
MPITMIVPKILSTPILKSILKEVIILHGKIKFKTSSVKTPFEFSVRTPFFLNIIPIITIRNIVP